MSRLFFRDRRPALGEPRVVDADPGSYARDWADYAEWSGLDQDRLPYTPPETNAPGPGQ